MFLLITFKKLVFITKPCKQWNSTTGHC